MRYLWILGVAAGLFACGQSSPSSLADDDRRVVAEWRNPEIERLVADQSVESGVRYMLEQISHNCKRDKIKGIEGVPLDHDDPDSPTFTYYFEISIKNPGEPVVVYLPGGPGGSSIGSVAHWTDGNYINIDPRGVGCNFATKDTMSLDMVTTEQTVKDVAHVIKRLDLHDFIVYGHSYGTVAGTHLVHELENNMTDHLPRTLLLEGTLGKSLGSIEHWYFSHFVQWDRLREEYPVVNTLFVDAENLPLGGSAMEWGEYVFSAGNDFEGLATELSGLAAEIAQYETTGSKGPIMRRLQRRFKGENPSYEPFHPQLTLVMFGIMCQELANPMGNFGVKLESGGGLALATMAGTPEPNDACQGIPWRTPYDSATMQLATPLVYLQGETDPQTSLESARYHFESQQESKSKEFILVENGSHGTSYEVLAPCMDKVWSQLKTGGAVSEVVNEKGYCKEPSGPERRHVVPKLRGIPRLPL